MMKTIALSLMLLIQGNEPALRARIAELEAQVKTLQAKLAANNPAPSGWRSIASWKGSGIKTTESFSAKSEWRVSWKSSTNGGLFQIMVYGPDGKLVTLAANTQNAGSDVSYVRGPAGRYYLVINSAGTNWEVTAEQQ